MVLQIRLKRKVKDGTSECEGMWQVVRGSGQRVQRQGRVRAERTRAALRRHHQHVAELRNNSDILTTVSGK